MSFYAEIKTELKSDMFIVMALEELKKRGEITDFESIVKKDLIKVNRSGDLINIRKTLTGEYQLEGDSRVINIFVNRLRQVYAYETIKESLPLDFEIVKEAEQEGNIMILLKG